MIEYGELRTRQPTQNIIYPCGWSLKQYNSGKKFRTDFSLFISRENPWNSRHKSLTAIDTCQGWQKVFFFCRSRLSFFISQLNKANIRSNLALDTIERGQNKMQKINKIFPAGSHSLSLIEKSNSISKGKKILREKSPPTQTKLIPAQENFCSIFSAINEASAINIVVYRLTWNHRPRWLAEISHFYWLLMIEFDYMHFSWWFLLTQKNIVTFFSFHLNKNWPKKTIITTVRVVVLKYENSHMNNRLPAACHCVTFARDRNLFSYRLVKYLETNQQPSIDENWKHIEFILWRDVAFDVDVAAAVLCTISNKHKTTNNKSHTNIRNIALKPYQRGYGNATVTACISTRHFTWRRRCFLSSRRWHGQPNTWWIYQRVQWTGKYY